MVVALTLVTGAALSMLSGLSTDYESDSFNINLSDRQRLMTQRVVMLTEWLALGDSEETRRTLRRELTESIDQLASTSGALAERAPVLTLSIEPLIADFLRDAQAVSRAPSLSTPESTALLQNLKEAADGELLAASEAIVAALETRARGRILADVANVRWLWLLTMAGVIALLAALAWSIRGSIRSVVEEIVSSREQARRVAQFDTLTGLPNRSLFDTELKAALNLSARVGSKLAVVAIDLDHFKHINDTLGHPAGDELLRVVADRMRDSVRDYDMVARLGGDEFAIILKEVADQHDVTIVAERILDKVSQPFELIGHELRPKLSMGVALAPADGVEPTELVSAADLALHESKASGRNTYRFFESELRDRVDGRLLLEKELRRGIEREEFELRYQPIHGLHDAHMSFETLLRWNHPTRGLLSPGAFLEVATESHLIGDIAAITLAQALSQASIWRHSDIPLGRLTINLDPDQLKLGEFANQIEALLAEHELPPNMLEVEVSERFFSTRGADALKAELRRLTAMGLTVAIDGFGLGDVGLLQTEEFPLTRVKISRNFTMGMEADDDAVTVLEAIVALAHSRNIQVTAEGIETTEQLDVAQRARVDEVQGYLLGVPVTAHEATNQALGLRESRAESEAGSLR